MAQKMKEYLWAAARRSPKPGLPILSFPAAGQLGVTVEELVKDAELQARAMEYVAANTPSPVAMSPMDLSVEAEAFGGQVCFAAEDVPGITGRLVSSEAEARALLVPKPGAGRTGIYIEGVRRAVERIPQKPLLAGMIGPFSLAGRLMDVTEIIYSCYDEPETVHIVLEKAAAFLIEYGKAMGQAGAAGILMAEPLTGVLNPDMAREFSVPYGKRVIEALQDSAFGVIYHNCGGSVTSMLEDIFSQGAIAYHFGNAVDMGQVLEKAPRDVLCMGNIEPAAQFAGGSPGSMKMAVEELMARCGGYENFLPSSGCDIPAQTSWENIRAFFEALSP